MHFFFFLIAVISTTAIAKPLPDAQTNTPFGYFPSDFGAAELYKASESWGGSALQRPDSNNPVQMDLTNPNGADTGNPSPISDGPAERDPPSSHTTTEHPPGTSSAFKQFREFWCGAHEGRDQSVCCLGNEYGTFRPFTGELRCEKKQWVLGAGTETIGLLDTRFLRYCHEPTYLYSCADYYDLYRGVQCYSDCAPIDAVP